MSGVPKRVPLVEQLKASNCALCKLAGEAIEQLRRDHAEEMKDAREEMRDSIADALHDSRNGDFDHW